MPAPQGMLSPFAGMDLSVLGGFDPSKMNLPAPVNPAQVDARLAQANNFGQAQQDLFGKMGDLAKATQARTDAMIDRLPQVQAQGPVAPQSFKPLTPRPGESASSPSFMLAQQRQQLGVNPGNPGAMQARMDPQGLNLTPQKPQGIVRLSEGPANYQAPPIRSYATDQMQQQMQQMQQQMQQMQQQQRARPPQRGMPVQGMPRPQPQRPQPSGFQQAMSYVKPVTQGLSALGSLFSLF